MEFGGMCCIWNVYNGVSRFMWLQRILRKRGLHNDVIYSIATNRIDSGLFLNLTENDLKEMAPVIGDRVCLRKILEEARKVGVLK